MKVGSQIPNVRARRSLDGMSRDAEGSLQEFHMRRRRGGSSDETSLHLGARLHTQIRSLEQARRDTSDGIAAVQTADRALQLMSGILVRMGEISEAARAELPRGERLKLQDEFRGALESLDRLSRETHYRGQHLLDGGAAGGISFRLGVGQASDEDTIVIQDLRSSSLGGAEGLSRQSVAPVGAGQRAGRVLGEAQAQIQAERAALRGVEQRLGSAVHDLGEAIERLLPGEEAHLREEGEAREVGQELLRQIKARPTASALSQANQSQKIALALLG